MNNNIIMLKTIVTKEINKLYKIYLQSMISSSITIIIYLFVFKKILNFNIIDNIRYVDYIVPGLIMINIINSSFSNVSFSFFNDRYYGNIEEVIVSYVPIHIIMFGYVIGGIIRGVINSTISMILSYLICKVYLRNIIMSFTIILLSTIIFSLLGLLVSLIVSKVDNINLILLLINPFIYLGGFFNYSENINNKILKYIIKLNPIYYIINIFRHYYININIENKKNIYLLILFIITLLFIINYLIIKYKDSLRI